MTPYLQDADVTLYNGDALEVLRTLPDRSVHMCACGCGTEIQNPDSRGRPRRFARGHNLRVDHPLHRPGVENWWTGRTHTPEARAKIAAKAVGSKPNLRGKRNGMAGRTGASNPNWKGGVSPERQRRRCQRPLRLDDPHRANPLRPLRNLAAEAVPAHDPGGNV